MSGLGRHYCGGMATTDVTYGQPRFSVKEEAVVKRERSARNFEETSAPHLPRRHQDQSPFLYSNTLVDSSQVEGSQESGPDLPISDMDLTGFLDMDDKTLSELTGVDSNDWTTLFNGQLDDHLLESDKTAPKMSNEPAQSYGTNLSGGGQQMQHHHQAQQQQQQQQQQQPPVDKWLVEETQRLERQQRVQQQKLLELQQTLLKTEILKNQLQIATISQGQVSTHTQMSSTSSMLLGSLGGGSQQQQQQQQQQLQPEQQNLQQQELALNSPLSSNGSGIGHFSTGTRSFPGSNCSSNPVSPVVSILEPKVLETGSNLSSPPPMLCTPPHTNVSNTPSPLLAQTAENPPMELCRPAVDIQFLPNLTSTSSSLEADEDDFPKLEPNKRKVHNLIEKKYRCSINDRICMLRDMVNKHNKDNKKLQKSAVLQKTIDFIHHLQNTIKRLQEENQQLKDALARATGGSTRLPSYTSPPTTPSGTLGGSSCDSESDSGNPSSPDSNDGMLSHGSSPTSKNPYFGQFLHNPIRPVGGAASQYLMMVMLVAVFFVNPLALSGIGGPSLQVAPHSAGYSRSLNAFDDMEVFKPTSVYSMAYLGLWLLRVVFALFCFGWMTLKAVPRVVANSTESVQYWRYRKQADRNIEEGDFTSAKENLEMALCAVNRPLPTSSLVMIVGLLWSFLSHIVFELMIGRYAVLLASYFVRAEKFVSPKSSTIVGVSFRDLSETYHLLMQIGLASPNRSHMHGMNYFLGLNALNCAEADGPFGRMTQNKRSEMYFTMGLCSQSTFLYASYLPKWYYFYRHRTTSRGAHATPLKWALIPPGKSFLMGSKWSAEVDISPKLYSGKAALPTYAVTRSFCKELLCETFHYLLLPDDSPSSQACRDSEVAVQAFKMVLKLAKEATASLSNSDGKCSSLEDMAVSPDSGFAVVRWWASVGIVSCYWLSGKDGLAENYYANIEALSGEMGAAVPSALQLAFKANRLYKRPEGSSDTKVPVQLVLELCATTSNALKGSVANLLQDQSNSTDNELSQLGLLLACDWLLSLKVTLWENHGKENGFSEDLCPGFYQDLETLAKLITLLPSAKSRLHLYKGCYQLIAGANPLTAHAMLSSTGSVSFIRRRANKDSEGCNPALCSHEHAMAKLMAYKHLPPSMESPYSLSPPSRKQTPTLQSNPTLI